MIETIGSFSVIWLACWMVLAVAFMLVYPFLRPLFMRLHPRHGSVLLLVYAAAPCLLSLSVVSLLFLPVAKSMLVQAHCHADCVSHAPLIAASSVAASGIVLVSAVLVALAGRILSALIRGGRMQRQFDALSRPCTAYRLLDSGIPMVFTLGWLNPRVYISTALRQRCQARELDVILRHEQAHRLRRDNLRLILARGFCLGLPAAVAGRFLSDLQLLSEQACDFVAAERFGELSVAETLLRVKRMLLRHARQTPQWGHAFTGAEVSQRVEALLQAERRLSLTPWQHALLACLVAGALLLAVEPLHHGAEWIINGA